MQMKKNILEEKGSMAVYVSIVLLGFLIILSGIYVASISVRKGQLETTLKIKQSYEKDNWKIDKVYDSQLAKLDPYIENGLILHYDGINNTGGGHSSTDTTWKDLSGNGNDATITGGTWATNSIKFTEANTTNGIQTNSNFPINFSQTFNIVFEYSALDGADPLFGSRTTTSDGFMIWNQTDNIGLDTKGSGTRISLGKSLTTNTKYNLTFTFSGTTVKVYRNGVLDNTTTFTKGSLDMPLTIFTAGAQNNSLGNVYSVKVYNRALTDAEVLQNYQVDQRRFGF